MDIFVIDTSSLIVFNKFYVFDKRGKNEVHKKLFDFIIKKIKDGEIIILDKVYEEIFPNNESDTKELKQAIKDYQKETLPLLTEVQRLIQKYKSYKNINMYRAEAVILGLEKYERTYADLYLIAYCLKLKNERKTPILITEETFKEDKKFIEKIPTICAKEVICVKRLPQVLFEIYKDELEFKLNINPRTFNVDKI